MFVNGALFTEHSTDHINLAVVCVVVTPSCSVVVTVTENNFDAEIIFAERRADSFNGVAVVGVVVLYGHSAGVSVISVDLVSLLPLLSMLLDKPLLLLL